MNSVDLLAINVPRTLQPAQAALWVAAAEEITRHVAGQESLAAQYQAACEMWAHGVRCAGYMRIMASSQRERDELSLGAAWHDAGKLCIPAAVLLAPRELTIDERQIVKCHAIQGRDMVLHATRLLAMPDTTLQHAQQMAAFHHERWDGQGYPEGLKGEAIPLAARMMAIIDVYDVITTARPYKSASSHQVACDALENEAGSHFDPELIKRFLVVESEIEAAAAWQRSM